METCAFDKGIDCEALREKNCVGCPFRKTHAELDAGREKARNRLMNLPKATQTHIRRKYYTT